MFPIKGVNLYDEKTNLSALLEHHSSELQGSNASYMVCLLTNLRKLSKALKEELDIQPGKYIIGSDAQTEKYGAMNGQLHKTLGISMDVRRWQRRKRIRSYDTMLNDTLGASRQLGRPVVLYLWLPKLGEHYVAAKQYEPGGKVEFVDSNQG
jgi:hypothetical protein